MAWQRILAADAHATTKTVTWLEKYLPKEHLKVHYELLELSCHGLPWLATTFTLLLFKGEHCQVQLNLVIGLLLDIVVVGILKAIVKRERPAHDPFAIGPDIYSFPSGHASRSTYLSYFFLHIWPLASIYVLPLLAWSFYVCISRVLLRRHYMLDVSVGALLGIIEGLFIHYIYLDIKTCTHAMTSLLEFFGFADLPDVVS